MPAEQLHVVTARFNPLNWRTPNRHYREWAQHMLDSGVRLTVVELQYGAQPFECELPHVNHLGVRADSWCWSKENLLNLGIQRLPDARFICWEDADILHRNAEWAPDTVRALQHYRVVQTWSQCLDIGAHGQVANIDRSFADCFHKGDPVVRNKPNGWWKWEGGKYDFAHSGYSWACQREFLNRTGGLLDICGMGSGDFHMATGMIGKAEWSLIKDCGQVYTDHVLAWQERAGSFVNGRLAAVTGTIEHKFHGSKLKRGYLGRWEMFARHGFNPSTDLKRNTYGVFEWAGNKPELEREWDLYLRSRREDDNCT